MPDDDSAAGGDEDDKYTLVNPSSDWNNLTTVSSTSCASVVIWCYRLSYVVFLSRFHAASALSLNNVRQAVSFPLRRVFTFRSGYSFES